MYSQCAMGTSDYTVQPGDTLYSVAERFNVSVEAVYQANPGVNFNSLQTGLVICIPSVTPPVSAPYDNMPPGNVGCSSCPWAQSFSTMVDPADPPQRQGPPFGQPPNFIPNEPPVPFAVDPGAIAGCLFRFTYLWLRNRQSFWAFPVFVGRRSIAGWRFNRGRWMYFGVDLREIRSFTCF